MQACGTPRTCLRRSCATKPPRNLSDLSSTNFSESSTPRRTSGLSACPAPWRNSPTSTAQSSPNSSTLNTSTTPCAKPCSTPATSTGQKSTCPSSAHCSSWLSRKKPAVAMVSTTPRRPTSSRPSDRSSSTSCVPRLTSWSPTPPPRCAS